MNEQNEKDQIQGKAPTSEMALPLAGVTFMVTEIGAAALHGGWLGAGAGVLGTVFMAAKGQQLWDRAQDAFSPFRSYMPAPKEKAGKSGRTVKERLLGIYPEDKPQPKEATALEEMEELAPNPLRAPQGLPGRCPSWREVEQYMQAGFDMLGYDGERLIYGEAFTVSVNMALIGLPRAGKTNCLRFFVAQAVKRGALVRGWDLHADLIAELGDLFHIYDDVDEIVSDCEWIQQEIKRRTNLKKAAKRGDQRAAQEWANTREVVYIVDEFVALMLRLKKRKAEKDLVTETVLSLIAEGAKFKMRIILAGQALPAALFGDEGSTARDIISVKYAFRSRDAQARMVGIEEEAIENLLPLIAGEEIRGYAILSGGPLLHDIIVSIPLTTEKDIRRLLIAQEQRDWLDDDAETGNGREMSGNGGKRLVEPMEMSRATIYNFHGNVFPPENEAFPDDGNAEMDEEDDLPEGVTSDDLDQIYEAFKAGWRASDIAALVHMEGRKYNTFRAACAYLGIDPKVGLVRVAQ